MQLLHDLHSQGHAAAYGADTITQRTKQLFDHTFGPDIAVLFVPTGTGANVLGLKLILQHPYEAVVTSDVSHVFEEETGALAMHTGAQLFTIAHNDGKVDLPALQQEVALRKELGFHSSVPKALSIANSTEYGTCYQPEALRQLADFCHTNDMYLHMDGCRLANAAAALGCDLRSLTRDAGVDVLSFGGAKNGLMNAEAVVIFNAPPSDRLRMQKQTMQLTSKMRYLAGQFIPYLTDQLWLQNAQHTNQLARQLADGLLAKLGARIAFTRPVETNQVFCILPDAIVRKLRRAGYSFYDWNSPGEVRLVTSWDNTAGDIQNFLSAI